MLLLLEILELEIYTVWPLKRVKAPLQGLQYYIIIILCVLCAAILHKHQLKPELYRCNY